MIHRIIVAGKRNGVFQIMFDCTIKAARNSITSIVIQMEWPETLVEVWDADKELTIALPDDFADWAKVCNWVRDTFQPQAVHTAQIINFGGGRGNRGDGKAVL